MCYEDREDVSFLYENFKNNRIPFGIMTGKLPNYFVRYKIFRAAYNVALHNGRKSNNRHGAVIFQGNRIISVGRNYTHKTHPKGSGKFSTIHAEVQAIIKALKINSDLSDYSILVIRIDKHNEIRMSRPCSDCMNLINRLGLTAVWTE